MQTFTLVSSAMSLPEKFVIKTACIILFVLLANCVHLAVRFIKKETKKPAAKEDAGALSGIYVSRTGEMLKEEVLA